MRFSADIVSSEPGRVLLSRSFFYPGGGGQLPDRGKIAVAGQTYVIRGVEQVAGKWWHLHDGPQDVAGAAELEIDREFRRNMEQLHTALHLVNAFVFKKFDGALVTGAHMAADRTARIDLDLPEADNERIRALEPEINACVAEDRAIRVLYVPVDVASRETGLLRSRSVAPPPQPDGSIRVVEIEGVDRQACGGTHLTSTGQMPPIQILKIENKGRHNRRVRIGFR
ncbi:alanyl-tRNA editing protein [Streptococcus pyogenes]|uniref:alanyl-tRNA editing protein n=1 Tax=Streptococcus pyogenes TaxID=1314 RepID=UPI003DA05808